MKKLFIIILISASAFSQKVIVERSLGKEKPLFNFSFLKNSNKLIIKEAFDKTALYGIFNYAFMFDENGKMDTLVNNDKFLKLDFSDDEKNYVTAYYKNTFASPNVKYYINDKTYKLEKVKDHLLFFSTFFNNTFQFKLTNTDNDLDINFKKEGIVLQKYNFISKSLKTVKLKKPNIERMTAKDQDVPNKIGFQKRLIDNNSFEIITKSNTEDQKTSALYRTIYNFEGEKINEIIYNYTLERGDFCNAATDSRDENKWYVNRLDQLNRPTNLDFNDYFIDANTQDLYLYGLAEEKNKPYGFYIIRYNNKGEKIWEKIYEIDDKKGFNNRIQNWFATNLNMYEYMNKDQFVISIFGENTYSDYYNHFFVINRENGNLERKANMDSDLQTSKGTFNMPSRYSIYETNKLKKNRYCSTKTLIAYSLSEKAKNYIESVSLKKDVFFDAFISSKGIWLIETDNDNYYKVTLFN